MSFSLVEQDRKFDLDHEFKKIFKGKLDFLLDKAPSDSTLKHQFSKMKKGYEGVIEIISSQGKFLARAIHHDPQQLAIGLVEDVYGQILSWRNRRFSVLS